MATSILETGKFVGMARNLRRERCLSHRGAPRRVCAHGLRVSATISGWDCGGKRFWKVGFWREDFAGSCAQKRTWRLRGIRVPSKRAFSSHRSAARAADGGVGTTFQGKISGFPRWNAVRSIAGRFPRGRSGRRWFPCPEPMPVQCGRRACRQVRGRWPGPARCRSGGG